MCTSAPSGVDVHCTAGKPSESALRACVAIAASWNVIDSVLPSRETAVRSCFSRSVVFVSVSSVSIFLSRAAFRSTCSRKWTPPRRSRPRYIGSACSLSIQRGDRGTMFSATEYGGASLSAPAFRPALMTSRAWIWVSVLEKRA